jgi:hypothetical protein
MDALIGVRTGCRQYSDVQLGTDYWGISFLGCFTVSKAGFARKPVCVFLDVARVSHP